MAQAIKRLSTEYRGMVDAKRRVCDYYAEPLEENMYEWHFTIKGPETDTKGKDLPYKGGIYHGKLTFPPNYPFEPPDIYFLTPNGRFKVNTKICSSVSSYHKELWNPTFDVGLVLTALRLFMGQEDELGIGGMNRTNCTEGDKLSMARESWAFKCPGCGQAASEVWEEHMAAYPSTAADRIAAVPAVPTPPPSTENTTTTTAASGADGGAVCEPPQQPQEAATLSAAEGEPSAAAAATAAAAAAVETVPPPSPPLPSHSPVLSNAADSSAGRHGTSPRPTTAAPAMDTAASAEATATESPVAVAEPGAERAPAPSSMPPAEDGAQSSSGELHHGGSSASEPPSAADLPTTPPPPAEAEAAGEAAGVALQLAFFGTTIDLHEASMRRGVYICLMGCLLIILRRATFYLVARVVFPDANAFVDDDSGTVFV